MIEITYERERDYGYVDRMLLGLKSEYLITATIRNFNTKSEYCYRTDNRLPLSEIFENTPLTEKDILSLFSAMGEVLKKLQDHLLKAEGLVLSPDRIMLNSEDHSPAFIYCPADAKNHQSCRILLAEFLINKVKSDDEMAIKLCYAFFETVNEEGSDLSCFLKQNIKEHINTRSGINKTNETRSDEMKINDNTMFISKKDEPSDGEEQYYYKAPVYEDEDEDPLINIPEKGLLKLLIVCAFLVVIAGSTYTYIFLNPALLKAAGISQQDYILAGAILTAFMAMIIISLLQMYVHRNKKDPP